MVISWDINRITPQSGDLLTRLMGLWTTRSKVGWSSLWNPKVWVVIQSPTTLTHWNGYLNWYLLYKWILKLILKWIWNMGRLCCSSEYEFHGVVAWPAIVFGSLEQYMLPIQGVIIVSNSNFITQYHCRILNKS